MGQAGIRVIIGDLRVARFRSFRGFVLGAAAIILAALLSSAAQSQSDGDAARIDKESRRLLDAVEHSQYRDLDAERKEVEEKVSEWKENLNIERRNRLRRAEAESTRRYLKRQLPFWTEFALTADLVKELRPAVPLAISVADADGIDVEKITRIYELMKKVIRTADFDIADNPRPDRDERLSTRFANLFKFAYQEEEELARALQKHQEYRLGLYKRATIAYIRALISGQDKAKKCSTDISRLSRVKVDGQTLPSAGCPDPVVNKLRLYLDAVRTIQSADTDALIAEIELLKGEQQLVADTIAGVPLVGEAMDIYAIYAGEDISGRKLSGLEKGFMTVFLAIPIVGGHAGAILEQVGRRSPKARAALARISDGMGRVSRYFGDKAQAMKSWRKEQLERFAGNWLWTKQKFSGALLRLRGLTPDPKDIFVLRSLKRAVENRKWIMNMSKKAREWARKRSNAILKRTLAARQGLRHMRIKASGMVASHADAFSDVARRRNEIFIARPVNPKATKWIEMGAATKDMTIKAKSASHGPFAGLIPVDEALNKTGSKLRDVQRRLQKATDVDDIKNLRALKEELEIGVKNGKKTINKCLGSKPKCAIEIDFKMHEGPMKGKQVYKAEVPGGGDVKFVAKDSRGKWVDAETGQSLDFIPKGKPKKVQVLGNDKGEYITADYDLLNIAEKGPHSTPTFSKAQGYTTKSQREALDEINDAVAGASGHKNRNVVHHGAEQNFAGTPGVDYPLTAFEPSGKVIAIPECGSQCMRDWCSATGRCNPSKICGKRPISGCVKVDKDRMLKDYYHAKRLDGFNLDPNPNWAWGGDYNPLSGWTHPDRHGLPAISGAVKSLTSGASRRTGREILRGGEGKQGN